MSTNNYVTFLLLENGTNLNTTGLICKNCKYYVHSLMRMRETSSYIKLSLATLCHQEIVSFDASNECQVYLLSQNTGLQKIFYFVRFMLINVNENFFVGLLIQLIQIHL